MDTIQLMGNSIVTINTHALLVHRLPMREFIIHVMIVVNHSQVLPQHTVVHLAKIMQNHGSIDKMTLHLVIHIRLFDHASPAVLPPPKCLLNIESS